MTKKKTAKRITRAMTLRFRGKQHSVILAAATAVEMSLNAFVIAAAIDKASSIQKGQRAEGQ